MKTSVHPQGAFKMLRCHFQKYVGQFAFLNSEDVVTQICHSSYAKKRIVTWFLYMTAIITLARPHASTIASYLIKYFTSTVHVRMSSEVHHMLTSWKSSRGLQNAATSHLAQVDYSGYQGPTSKPIKQPLQYIPFVGTFWLRYKWYLIFCRVSQEDAGYSTAKMTSLTCLGRSSKPLKDLLQECQEEYIQKFESKIGIWGHRGSRWHREKTKDARPIETVILRESEKSSLIKDIKEFLKPETEKWYTLRSIPYRRGYLFHGPPGTGKSSFSFSIAGMLDMDMYVVSIPSLDDETLQDLFSKIPDKCVVLLEDIDAVDSACSRSDALSEGGKTSQAGKTNSQVTRDVLLNVLDGVASKERVVVIVTTNHPDKLDEAFKRPGRVDMQVGFKLANRDIIEQIFRYMFQQTEESPVQGDNQVLADEQANEFTNQVPEDTFSAAEIMSFLYLHKNDPQGAINGVKAWIETMQRKGI